MSANKKVFSIPWQDSGSYRKGKYLLDTGLMADCSFMVGEGPSAKRFDCHKVILIAASPVFETMFCGNFAEASTTSSIPIPDSQPEDFRLFLEFIYDPCQSSARIYYDESCSDYSDEDDYRYSSYSDAGESRDDVLSEKFQSYNFETLKNLLYLGNKYMIKSLGRQCCLALNQQLRIGNEECILKIFELAVTTEHKGLAKKSALHFEQEFSLVACEVVYDLDASILSEFLKLLELTPSREVLETISLYIERNSLNVEANDVNEFEYGICTSCENPYKRKRTETTKQSDAQYDWPKCQDHIKSEKYNSKRNSNSSSGGSSSYKKHVKKELPNDGEPSTSKNYCSSSSHKSAAPTTTTNNNSTNTPLEPAERQRNLEIVKQLYESINFSDMDPLEFMKAAKKSRFSEYLSYRRKYEIVEKLCKNQRDFGHQRKRKWHLINYVK